MANDLHRSVLSNPMVLWADLSLRALDMSLSLSHSICNGVDRLTRAAASDQAVTKGTAWRSTVSGSFAPTAAAEDTTMVAATSERPGFDLMTQGWMQWMSTLGTVVSLGTHRNPIRQRHQQDAECALEHAVASAAPKSAPPAHLRSPVRKQARSR